MKVKKDPQAILDYSFDWTDWLSGDQIVTTVFSVTGGCVVDSFSHNGFVSTAWISGGDVDSEAELTCRVTTNSSPARVDERTMILQIVQR